MSRIGSPFERNETPACVPGKNPDDQSRAPMACSCSRLLGVATSTTNVGRFLLSEPNPYETHAPRHGRPLTMLPVCISVMAGSWLMASVFMERMKHMSSADLAMLGITSESHMPHLPCCANLYFDGATGKRVWPDVIVVSRCPCRIESGKSLS